MNQKEIDLTQDKLNELLSQIYDIKKQLYVINPDQAIGEERRKMIQTLNYAQDVAYYGQLVLNDDPYVLYQDLAEDMRE